jgi:dihydroorotate dehydrogenase
VARRRKPVARHGSAGLLPVGGGGTFPATRPHPTRRISVIPYRLLRAPLFGLPAETAHNVAIGGLRAALGIPVARELARRALSVEAPELSVRRWGIDFPNPVGLAAGFDKSGAAFNELGALGFGFIEIGTVTAEAQPGNPRPRLFRLPEDRALVNRMGFNNPGAEAVARELRSSRIEPVLGVNIGKSRVTPIDAAIGDYLRSVDLLHPYARYVVVNVSSPNTPGLRSLQEAGPLRELITAVVARLGDRAATAGAEPTPVLVKLAPDLENERIDEAVAIGAEAGAGGIIATNTTTARTGLGTAPTRVESIGPGGLSGAPLAARARAVVSRIHARTGGTLPIIGVGGIFSADDAWEMIRAGASLVQVYTGFIYEGPELPRKINTGLLRRMRRDGIPTLDDVVGAAHT